jgi:PPOX class probable F420-dependent enzyme
MQITSGLPNDRRVHIEARIATNLMAWLTTVNPAGRPDTVPVWFYVCDDDRILIYSQQGKAKLRNIVANAHVALGLDVTDLGRDIIRFEGTAITEPNHLRADQVPGYVSKYTERIAAIFGTVEHFANSFSEAILVTPTRLHA